MRCPKCRSSNNKVLESRTNSDGSQIRRRRMCLNCNHRFTSYERIEERPIIVIKKDGRRQSFDISKVERGIRTSIEKLDIPEAKLTSVLNRIEENVQNCASSNNTITSREVGELTLKELYDLSPVAYVRFASVYRAFDNVGQFADEIRKIEEGTRRPT